jgi:CMP-N-acetylneuraminic acid synthetase
MKSINAKLRLETLAIIPARSGSTRLRDKNIKLLNGHPLMAYTISAALNSNIFDKVIVSTDSIKYSLIAQKYGADVDFLRPLSLSTEASSSIDLIRFTINEYQKKGLIFNQVCLLQPTSPLRNSIHIKEAINLFLEENADSLISVCSEKINEHKVLGFERNGHFRNSNSNSSNDKAPLSLNPNGAIYIFKSKFIMSSDSYYSNNTMFYLMDAELSSDIDLREDFELVEIKVKSNPDLLEKILYVNALNI